MAKSWSESDVAILRQMLDDGKSASMISAAMPHHSRNSVCGRVNRMGLSKRVPPELIEDRKQRRIQRQKAAERAAALSHLARRPKPAPLPHALTCLVSEPAPQPTGDATRYGDMAPDQCRWFYEPFDDVPVMERMVCSETAETGTSYCAHHYARVWNRPPPRQPAVERKNFITKDPRRKPAFISEGA